MNHDQNRSLDEMVRPGDVAMLILPFDDGALTGRPLTVAEVHGGVLTFLVDGASHWVDLIERRLLAAHPDAVGAVDRPPSTDVHLAIATGRNDWLSLRGRPALSADPITIDRLWNPIAAAFFDGREDEGIRALQVSLIEGEHWSAPGGGALGRLASAVTAALGFEGERGGIHGEIERD